MNAILVAGGAWREDERWRRTIRLVIRRSSIRVGRRCAQGPNLEDPRLKGMEHDRRQCFVASSSIVRFTLMPWHVEKSIRRTIL